jgi:hypothetical protein
VAELLSARPLRQWLLLGFVGVALLLLGLFDEPVRDLLTDLFTTHQPATAAPVAEAPAGPALTTRNLPAMVVFGLSYIGLSILTLHLALANRRQTLIVGLVYGGVLGAVGGLLVLGKLLGSPSLALPARELIDNVLSPLPVLLLLAALRLAPR